MWSPSVARATQRRRVLRSPRPKRGAGLPAFTIGAFCAALGKRHPDQDKQLRLTHRNSADPLADARALALLGVRAWILPDAPQP
jgi:hypothetical protein